MAQPPFNGPYGTEAADDNKQQAREFLAYSREFLSAGNLHLASEKAWGAAAWMTKAVATAQGWEYNKHDQFSAVLNNARQLTGDDRIRSLRSIANELHGNYHKRKFLLNADAIGLDLESIAELLDILEPLTDTTNEG